jgi:hypothetical protein
MSDFIKNYTIGNNSNLVDNNNSVSVDYATHKITSIMIIFFFALVAILYILFYDTSTGIIGQKEPKLIDSKYFRIPISIVSFFSCLIMIIVISYNSNENINNISIIITIITLLFVITVLYVLYSFEILDAVIKGLPIIVLTVLNVLKSIVLTVLNVLKSIVLTVLNVLLSIFGLKINFRLVL